MLKVLFVCTGNICRSPTAKGVFRHRVERAGLADRILTDSAGTHGYHVGELPDSRTQAAARRRDYELSGIRARRLQAEDPIAFQHLLAMDAEHLALLRRLSSVEHQHKVRLFLDFAPHLQYREIPDPYYGDADGFELVLDRIEEAADGLLEHVKLELEGKALP